MTWNSTQFYNCFQMRVMNFFLGHQNGCGVVWDRIMGVLQQIFYMKQFRVVSLSSRGQFIVQEGDGSSRELPIEGFRVSLGVHVRALFADLLGHTIECTLNKNGTHIRYQNEVFLAKQVAAGAMEVVQKELEESKIYSPAQKARFLAIVSTPAPFGRCVDLTADRRAILKYFPRAETVVGRVEWVGQQLVVRVARGEELLFVPLRLKNVNCLFACLEEAAFAPLFIEHPTLDIKIASPIYNVTKRRFELNGELDANVEEKLLRWGWGLVQGGAVVGAKKSEQYLRAEAEAKEQHRGIFGKSTQILGFIYAKNNFVGTVWDVLDGYVLEVARKGTQEKLKIELAMVRSPVGDELGAFNSRQFTRKQLIGEEVNVYLHKDSGLNMTGSVVRARDSKDVESLLVEQGWGFVREEFVNSVLCLKLNDLEKRAREKMRGLHSKEVGVFRPEDLTLPNTQKEEFYVYHRLETLKKLGENECGVLEGLIDTTIFKVWLEEKNIILRVRLEGVLGHNLNPQLEEVKAMKEELRATYERTMKRRSAIVTIIDYQKQGNNFIGTIAFPNGPNLQEILLTSSYVYADKENSKPTFRALEDKARTGGRGVWSANLINFEPVNPLALQAERFRGRFSWVEDGQTVFIQPDSNYKTLDRIAVGLTSAKLIRAVREQITNGALYGAPYEGELYRALVTSVKGKRVKVLFIDWGNRGSVEDSSLWELPEPLKLIERQALKAKLALTKPTKNQQYLERIRGQLMDGDEYQFRKEGAEYVACYRNKQYMNLLLIERGLVKSNHAKAPEGMRSHLAETEGILFRNRVGVWEWSDAEDPSSLDSDDD